MAAAQVRQFLLCLLLMLLAGLDGLQAARAGSRGTSGARSYSSGSRSYSSGSRSYSGSRSTYRSSSTSYRSSSRSPSRLYSSYISYVPAYRYTRSYASVSLGRYAYYYSLYWAYARSATYMRRSTPSDSVGVCANYEASDNGTALGVFTCPFPFEPSSFTRCCGYEYAEYCCAASNDRYIIAGVVGFLILACIAAFIVYRVWGNQIRVKIYPQGQVLNGPPQGRGGPGRGRRQPPPHPQNPHFVQPMAPPPYAAHTFPPARPGAPPYQYGPPVPGPPPTMPPPYAPGYPGVPPSTVSAHVPPNPQQWDPASPGYGDVTKIA